MSASGITQVSRVTMWGGDEVFPWWVPGGKQLTYTHRTGTDTDVYLSGIGGGLAGHINLTNSSLLDAFARVRPTVITP
jgi:Tol biopolymer transport system component